MRGGWCGSLRQRLHIGDTSGKAGGAHQLASDFVIEQIILGRMRKDELRIDAAHNFDHAAQGWRVITEQ